MISKESSYLLHVAAALFLWAAWMQAPFLLYSRGVFLHLFAAKHFNLLTGGIGLLAFLLLFCNFTWVLQLGVVSATLLTLIHSLTIVGLRYSGGAGPWPWPLRIPWMLNVCGCVVFWLLWISSKFFERRQAASGVRLHHKVFLALLAIGAGLIFTEWACRTCSSSIWSEASDWRWYTLKVKRNELNLRGEPLTARPSTNAVRLLLLGDSFTLGYKVDQDQIYATRLEREWTPPPNLEVLNGSQVNWSIDEEQRLYARVKEVWPPHIVIVAHVLNDMAPNDSTPPMPTWQLWAIYNLYSYRLIRPWLDRGSSQRFIAETLNAYDPRGRHWVDYFHQLEQLQKEVESRGGRFGVYFSWIMDFHHYPFEIIHSDLHRQLDRMRIPYLDLLDVFRPYPVSELAVTKTDVHPSALAHGLTARALASFIRRRLLASP